MCERDEANGSSDPTDLGLSKSVIPKLLRLSWMGYPLHRHKDEKWGYLVPKPKSTSAIFDDDVEEGRFPMKALEAHLEIKAGHKTGNEDLDMVLDPPDRSGIWSLVLCKHLY